MSDLKNTIWTPAFTEFVTYKEGAEEDKSKHIKMYGILMPQGEISRNRVLYDWESVKANHKSLLNKPVMYNHETEGIQARSLGHYIMSDVMTVGEALKHTEYKILGKEIQALNYPPEKELWLYCADLDPQEEYYINKIRRGDLRHVSIQLKADRTEEQYDGNGNEYTTAYVDDIIESSIVPTPGFLQTCAVLAEKYGGKKISKEAIKKGDRVKINPLVTTDPYKSAGKVGIVSDINKDGDVVIKLSNGKFVVYDITTLQKEDVSTTTGAGAVGPPLMPEDEENKKAEAFIEALGEQEIKFLLKYFK